MCEDIVQDLFVSLWLKRADQSIQEIKAYLYGAARYGVLNHIRSLETTRSYTRHFALFIVDRCENMVLDKMALSDLRDDINEGIQDLPERCQEAFRLSRFNQLSIEAIAKKMKISKRTTENYITKTLKHLRVKKSDILIYTIFFFTV